MFKLVGAAITQNYWLNVRNNKTFNEFNFSIHKNPQGIISNHCLLAIFLFSMHGRKRIYNNNNNKYLRKHRKIKWSR